MPRGSPGVMQRPPGPSEPSRRVGRGSEAPGLLQGLHCEAQPSLKERSFSQAPEPASLSPSLHTLSPPLPPGLCLPRIRDFETLWV